MELIVVPVYVGIKEEINVRGQELVVHILQEQGRSLVLVVSRKLENIDSEAHLWFSHSTVIWQTLS